jgi:hypothetical protein
MDAAAEERLTGGNVSDVVHARPTAGRWPASRTAARCQMIRFAA